MFRQVLDLPLPFGSGGSCRIIGIRKADSLLGIGRGMRRMPGHMRNPGGLSAGPSHRASGLQILFFRLAGRRMGGKRSLATLPALHFTPRPGANGLNRLPWPHLPRHRLFKQMNYMFRAIRCPKGQELLIFSISSTDVFFAHPLFFPSRMKKPPVRKRQTPKTTSDQ